MFHFFIYTGTFVYCEENHTSVVGMREVVGKHEKGENAAKVCCIAKPELEKVMNSDCHCGNSKNQNAKIVRYVNFFFFQI